MKQEMLYIYESHMGGYYCTLEEQKDTRCDSCGDGDFLIDRIERQEIDEPSKILTVLITDLATDLAHSVLNDPEYFTSKIDWLIDQANEMYVDYINLLVKRMGVE